MNYGLSPTATRVPRHTADEYNRRIAEQTERSVRFHARHPRGIDRRLRELDREWDIERALEANAATPALAGTLLGASVDRRFLVLPTMVTGFLLQHALRGWCPPVPFFRKRGAPSSAGTLAVPRAHERDARAGYPARLPALRGTSCRGFRLGRGQGIIGAARHAF